MNGKYSYYVTENVNNTQLLRHWDTVCDDIQNLSFTQKNEWFNAHLESDIEKELYFCFVVLLCDEKAVAIFPMQYSQLSRFGLSLNAWQILSPNELNLNDLVFSSAKDAEAILAQLIKYLNTEQKRPWDILALQHCRQGGAVDAAISQNKPPRFLTLKNSRSDYLVCESTQNNSVTKLSSKFKRNIRRLKKKLQQKGELSIHMNKGEEQLAEAFEEFIELESSGWKGSQKTSLLHDKKLQSFYRSLLEKFGDSNACVIHTMKLDGRAIASQLSVITDGTYNMLKIAYDEEYKLLAPGSILIDETVSFFSNDETVNKVSFVTGGGWQQKWSPETLYVAHHSIYNGTMKGNLCYLLGKGQDYLRLINNYIKSKRH